LRIVFATYDVGLSGGVRAIFEVAERLKKRNYNVSVLTLGGDYSWIRTQVPVQYVKLKTPALATHLLSLGKMIFFKRIRRAEIHPIELEAFTKRIGIHLDLVRLLAETLININPEVAIATWYPTALAVWLSGVERQLFFVQDFPEVVKEYTGEYGLKMFEKVLQLPFLFLANSSYTRELILSLNKNARVKVAGVGVNIETFYPRNKKIIDSGGKPIVMAILRSASFKGARVALESLNIVNRKMPIHALLVAERNINYLKRLFREVKPTYKYTVFRNVDDDTLAKLYSSSDVFIFTSYRESFGLPPLEAMACGTPVVTTDCGGDRDYAVNGYNALVVPPGDPQALARAVIEILTNSNLRERLVEAGLATVKQWTWDRVVDRFEEALRDFN
jgi:glycosyltransferase involved in cell wall biosynthesis